MLTLASFSDFLGNLWFAGLALCLGYLAGNVAPVSWVLTKFKR